ncbi:MULTISPECIES: hypothetical protein [Thalassospira]|uniref:CHASE3 domain-containing protein n=1 Tax=Thalassospira profundimaris TaxID=502049 RepID=A0A367VKG1_9PROT|nr:MULTISPECIES: hypothetical protein [Thalassospira]KZB70678.1 hypothetical protein AUQ43_07325 [Thalassospira sp. MCCC 1A01148]MBR9899637.1 hypothetical protein [Rhodospirillales bacterium]RCK25694.1 hypothetical protein TH6_03600 [Thalassospira profundimaris]
MDELNPSVIIAAFIAGFFSFVGIIISKENKTSEFRQDWINSLRSEVANLISCARAAVDGYQFKVEDVPGHWERMKPDFQKMNEAGARVRMLLNPSESLSKEVLSTLVQMEKLFTNDQGPDREKLYSLDRKLVEQVNAVLKEEWERVKAGEPAYKRTKYLAGVISVIAFSMTLVWFFMYLDAS